MIRRYGEVDWIRCSNPNCGKWRACLRTMDGRALREKYPVCTAIIAVCIMCANCEL